MRRSWFGILLLAACASPDSEPVARPEPAFEEPAAPASGPSAARDVADLEPWDGREVTLYGTFDHIQATHGVVRLPSGLRVILRHFDLFARGADWHRYVGNPCRATGRLTLYTRNIEGYHGPGLDVVEFQGSYRE
ncbi:MAG TPA: hypothetical protein VNO22_02660 [Planctomycetota bacterium]|nr:hypothetical protein [Planctomycetota bacterium]